MRPVKHRARMNPLVIPLRHYKWHIFTFSRWDTSSQARFMRWNYSVSLRWSRGRTLHSFGRKGTSWLSQTAPGWYRYGKSWTTKLERICWEWLCVSFHRFSFVALFCIPRWPLPLHGDGVHAGWWLGESDEQLRRPREMGALLHCWGGAGPGWNPLHGLHPQVHVGLVWCMQTSMLSSKVLLPVSRRLAFSLMSCHLNMEHFCLVFSAWCPAEPFVR